MTPASCARQRATGRRVVALLGAAAVVLSLLPKPAAAAIETDPAALYATMKRAYDAGIAHHWAFADEQYYLSTIFDAGRAYSLFRPDDPNYAELANLTVSIATQLHYDPLTSDDAASWYVNEAAQYAVAHGDGNEVAQATALSDKVAAGDKSAATAASDAEADAQANVREFPGDGDALAMQIVADVRAYNITHDATYRSAMLAHGADPKVPLVRVPDTELGELFDIVLKASGSDDTFTDDDRANAKVIDDRRKHTPDLQVIGRVHASSHELRMTHTAPADEYFGKLRMSPIGVRNEMARIAAYLDVGWDSQMTGAALNLANSVDDWQHQYPHDGTLPPQLLKMYRLLMRIDSSGAHEAADHFKTLLLVEYSSSSQARELSSS
jgi:hypothetical protein